VPSSRQTRFGKPQIGTEEGVRSRIRRGVSACFQQAVRRPIGDATFRVVDIPRCPRSGRAARDRREVSQQTDLLLRRLLRRVHRRNPTSQLQNRTNIAITAPGARPRRCLMKAAVLNTGPGLTCPTATASSNCACVSQCRRATRSAWRKASCTYPLPKMTAPNFRKTKNNPSKVTGTTPADAAATGKTGLIPAGVDSGPAQKLPSFTASRAVAANPQPNKTKRISMLRIAATVASTASLNRKAFLIAA
jgi:hypothetical protein